jgi:hypothetical protein
MIGPSPPAAAATVTSLLRDERPPDIAIASITADATVGMVRISTSARVDSAVG